MKQLANTLLNYSLGFAYIVEITHMEGAKIFGSYKWKANLVLGLEGNSHRHDHVIFFHPRVNHTIVESSVDIEQHGVDQIQEDVEVLEAPCGDGVCHIKICPPMLHVQHFGLQKSMKNFCYGSLCWRYEAQLCIGQTKCSRNLAHSSWNQSHPRWNQIFWRSGICSE